MKKVSIKRKASKKVTVKVSDGSKKKVQRKVSSMRRKTGKRLILLAKYKKIATKMKNTEVFSEDFADLHRQCTAVVLQIKDTMA